MTEIELGRFARALEGALGFVARKAYRRPGITLALVALVTAFAGHQTRRLRVDLDGKALLPASLPSVQGLEEVERRYGGVGDVVLVAEHPDDRTLDPDDRTLARFAGEAVRADLLLTTVVALLLVLFYVTFHFRGVRAVPVVVLPLGIGLIWTFGAVASSFETLDILTAFTGAILLGLGVDHGIHFLERFEAERARGRSAEEAVGATFAGTGRAVVLAGLTTAAGFAGLTISESRDFREFGIVALMGVGLVVAAYVLCVPPFLRLSHAGTKPRTSASGGVFRSYARFLVKWSGAVFCAVTVVVLLLAPQAVNLAVDDDLASLEDPVARSEGGSVIRRALEVRDLARSHGRNVPAAREAVVRADMRELVRRGAPRVLLATLVLVLAALWGLLGRFRLAVLCFMPAVITVVMMLGAAPLLGLELNNFNIVLVPVLLGVAVGAGVHLVVRGGGASREHLVDAMHGTGRAVWGGALTTAMGFGALLLAGHPGLDSLGRLALVGLAAHVVATFVWLGSLLALRHLRAERLAAAGLAGPFSSRLAADIATVGGAGYAKRAPGTFGTLAGLPVAWVLGHVDLAVRFGVIAGLVGLSVAVAYRYAAGGTEDSDPQEIVVDELVGVLIPLAVVPWSWPWVAVGFVLFRFFDIAKPGPVGWVDRRMKNPAGVILDDVVAGGLAAGVLVLARAVMG